MRVPIIGTSSSVGSEVAPLFTISFQCLKQNHKLAGLWLAGEVVNHVGIYGSKVAEGLSAYQRRSCLVIQGNILIAPKYVEFGIATNPYIAKPGRFRHKTSIKFWPQIPRCQEPSTATIEVKFVTSPLNFTNQRCFGDILLILPSSLGQGHYLLTKNKRKHYSCYKMVYLHALIMEYKSLAFRPNYPTT